MIRSLDSEIMIMAVTYNTLPSGSIRALIRSKGMKPVSKTFPSREAAEEWAKTIEQGSVSNENNSHIETPVLVPATSLDAIGSLYAESVRFDDNGKVRGGYETAVNRISVIARHLHQKPLSDLTETDIDTYKAERLKMVSGSTVRLELQMLSRVLKWGKRRYGFKPADLIEYMNEVMPAPGAPREKTADELEYKMIYEAISDKMKPILELAYLTAMRRGEIIQITPAMVDIYNQVINLAADQTKNGCARKVPLSKAACDLLKQLCDGRDKKARLFPYEPHSVTKAFRRAADKAGVSRELVFHSMRHTRATIAAEKGLSTLQIMAITGHKDVSMVVRYTHLKAENVAKLLD
ncbi:site-specific integrase [Salmonella enterica subsp. enterica serovar 4,[5],12:b:-]|nr:site-specific integrase [Salmonella enterica subsp. enterica serovar 4,[5],12:b:-]